MNDLFRLIRPYRLRLAGALLALLSGSGINLLFPELIRRALEPQVFPRVLEHLPLCFGVLAALFIVQGVAFYLRSLLFGLLGHQVYADVREQLFTAIIGREVAFFDRTRSGDLASRINSDAALVQDLVATKLSVILRYGAQVIIGTALMAWMSWQMTTAIVASVVCIVLVSALFIKSLKAASRRFQSSLAALSAFSGESFAGVKVIRSLGSEPIAINHFLSRSREVLAAGQGRARISAAFSSGASLLLNILLLGVLWFGISLVARGRLPVNDLAAFALYGSIVAVSFAFLTGAYSEVTQSLGGLDRVFELMKAPTGESAPQSEILGSTGPSIAFANVSFSYPERATSLALDGLSFATPAASTIGIMGPSGAGKSSVIQLLLKFYPPAAGEITLNGVSLSSLSNRELRSKVAWVPQEPLLFGFSILENITLGDPLLTEDAVSELVSRWGFLDFIKDLPEGLRTPLGEAGTQLSGGQRQRLAIARALVRKPKLLLLDEATSALDSALEGVVLATIRRELPDATVVIVSHRVSSVAAADTILVVNEGKIMEQGSHNQLKDAGGLYAHYVARQVA